MPEIHTHFDVLIVGSGLVGASLALTLASLPLRIAIIEAKPLATDVPFDQDTRNLALNYASVEILRRIAIWPTLAPLATPIETVHVSQRGSFGKTRIHARDQHVAALGHVVPAVQLANTLNKALLDICHNKTITLFNPAKVIDLQKNPQGFLVTLELAQETQQITASLVIGADGTGSRIRELQNIASETRDYQQSALATTVTISHDHQNIAYERFIKQGAIALLPLQGRRYAFIWTTTHAKIHEVQQFTDQEFLQLTQTLFGYRLGRLVAVGKRHVYPLKMLYAKEQCRPNLLLLGNAAHTLHPIAAQGFNLGLNDSDLLAKVLAAAIQQHKKIDDFAILQHYIQQRETVQKNIMRFTDNVVSIFSHDFFPLNWARSSVLLALDVLTPLKQRLARRLMGNG